MSNRISGPNNSAIPRLNTAASALKSSVPQAEKLKGAGDRLAISNTNEPETRIAKELSYSIDSSLLRNIQFGYEAYKQSKRADKAPGTYLCRSSDGGKNGIRQLREKSPFEKDLPLEGLTKTKTGWVAPLINNPNDPEGKFDPFTFMPNIVFDAKEDSYPILPDLDGDGDPHSDAKTYQHGVIGGNQPLEGSFSVAKKGEYTVLTYSLFYADNKFANYHTTDSSTFAVYLKPGKDGKLQPDKLYTSWHYGANMADWDDLQKGPDGKPIIKVERGSHALHPVSKQEKAPSKGLYIQGNGEALKDGKSTPNRLSWVSPNGNVENARVLNPLKDKLTLNTYYSKYPERTHPIHPILFEKK